MDNINGPSHSWHIIANLDRSNNVIIHKWPKILQIKQFISVWSNDFYQALKKKKRKKNGAIKAR